MASGSQPSYEYDVAVIGAGSAGFAAARTAAAEGLRTVLLDGADELGGLCILRGCMPTKALLYAAEVMHLASRADTWGINVSGVSANLSEVMARKNKVIREFADFRRNQLTTGKFELMRAMARFETPHSLQLSTGRHLTAAHFIIATGSTLAPSPLPELDALECLNSDTALKLERLPESLIMLGGGPVALEFAQFFARLGVQVTLVQRSPHILSGFDADAASELEKALQREGLVLYTGTKVLDARRQGDKKEVTFTQDGRSVTVRATEVFHGLGRVPHIEPLGLANAGVQLQNGRVLTNPAMQTSVPHIYAAGDCTGLFEIVHVAIQQGETAAHNLTHPARPRQMDYRLLTEVVFTEPQVANVGLTEKQARAQDIPFLAASYPFNDHGKSIIMDVKEGFVKLLANPLTGEIIGGCCVGPSGGELIHEIVAAMAKRMTVPELALLPHYHPTLAEIWTYPAEELASRIPTAGL